MNGPLGIAIAPDGDTAYVTNSNASTVTPIDLKSSTRSLSRHRFTWGVVRPPSPSRPNGATAYVSNFNSNTVTPIDLATSPRLRDVRSPSVTDRGASR